MNRIYLDKLCEFILTCYKNQVTPKNINLNEIIDTVKQNNLLNENGLFLKHNFIELKLIIPSMEYDQLILINPLCFNLFGNLKWYNFLNALLTVLNDNYLHETNLIKKNLFEIADKTYKKKIMIENELNDLILDSVCVYTYIILILIDCETIKIYNYDNNKKNKMKFVVLFNFKEHYYPVINWNKKYFEKETEFITFLINKANLINSKSMDKNSSNLSNDNSDSINNNIIINKIEDNETDYKKNYKINNDDINNDDINNKDYYEELPTNENYAIYVSEVVDNKQSQKKKIIIDNKNKKKKNKSIFVLNPDKVETEIIKEEHKLTDPNNSSSTFIKTENISKKDADNIINNLKITLNLDQIQQYAIKLGINIFNGATKTGKPKNKTKSELIINIKEICKDI
jgi:hypothetical protein